MPGLEIIDSDKVRNFGIDSSGGEISRQEYSPELRPEGVTIVKLPVFADEYGGHFLETARFEDGFIQTLKEKGIDLDLRNGQSNTSVVASGTERFGHLHRDQNELWIVVDGVLTVALYDTRIDSSTYGLKSKLVLATGMGVRIPSGVAHGLANYTDEKAVLTYFASHHFSPGEETQEWRFKPKDEDFWDFARPDKI